MKIAAKKEHKFYSGSIPQIAKLIGINPVTLRRWNREHKWHVYKYGFEITFDYIDLSNRKKDKKP
jgi:uncharacterized protein YjcR